MSFLSAIYRNKWCPPANPSPSKTFANQTILITGSNTGLGFESALKFAQFGASQLILGVRSIDKGLAAKSAIEIRTKLVNPDCKVVVWQLDMSSYPSVQSFAQRANTELHTLDVAVLNAGVYMPSFIQSAHGWEETLQVNLLSTSLLALLLLPKLKASRTDTRKPVLEFVGSGLHYKAKLTADQLSYEGNLLGEFNKRENFVVGKQYGISKLFLMYAMAAVKDLAAPSAVLKAGDEEEPDVFVTCVCPGACGSELGRGFDSIVMRIVKWIIFLVFMRTVEEGSRTLVTGIGVGEKGHGRFWQNYKIRP